jgi:hypothetical protein
MADYDAILSDYNESSFNEENTDDAGGNAEAKMTSRIDKYTFSGGDASALMQSRIC